MNICGKFEIPPLSREKYSVRTDRRTTNGQRTDGQPENMMSLPPIIGGGGIKTYSNTNCTVNQSQGQLNLTLRNHLFRDDIF